MCEDNNPHSEFIRRPNTLGQEMDFDGFDALTVNSSYGHFSCVLFI